MTIFDSLSKFQADANRQFARYKSWNHCYQHFQDLRQNHTNTGCLDSTELDLAALNLFAYLASWGMLRNSPLMDFDYRIMTPVVKEVTSPEFDALWSFDPLDGSQLANARQLLFGDNGLIPRLSLCIYEQGGFWPTDILVSKIVLGTQASMPAYDNILREGLRRHNLGAAMPITKRMGKRSYTQIAEFYKSHRSEFEAAKVKLRIDYPAFKLVDMHFWTRGRS